MASAADERAELRRTVDILLDISDIHQRCGFVPFVDMPVSLGSGAAHFRSRRGGEEDRARAVVRGDAVLALDVFRHRFHAKSGFEAVVG